MKKTSLNRGWVFMAGEKSSIPMMPQQTKEVNLPHDFMERRMLRGRLRADFIREVRELT